MENLSLTNNFNYLNNSLNYTVIRNQSQELSSTNIFRLVVHKSNLTTKA
jgi:hypothetical protein